MKNLNGSDLNTMYLPELVDMTMSCQASQSERDAATATLLWRLPRSSFHWDEFTGEQQNQIKAICRPIAA